MTKAFKKVIIRPFSLIILLMLSLILTGCFGEEKDDNKALDLSVSYSNVKLVMNGISGVEYYIQATISNSSSKTKRGLTVHYYYVDASTLARYNEEKYVGDISGNTTITFQSYTIIANGVANYGITSIDYS